MKKISYALFASLLVAGAASAQTPDNGITMSRDANVAAQIEQHAQDVQAQPPMAGMHTQAMDERAPAEVAQHNGKHHHHHRHHHHHHGKHPAQPTSAQAGQ